MADHPPAMPHEPLRPLTPDVWWLRGSVRMFPTMTINRVMVVVRHAGELTLINAVRPEDPKILEELGEVKHVVKIGTHGMDDAWFAERYGATRWAAEGAVGAEGADAALGPDTDAPVPGMRCFAFEETRDPELALVLDREGAEDGLLVTCDAVQSWQDTALCSLPAKVATYAMGFNARPAQIGPPWRKRMTPDGGSLERDFRRLLELPFDAVIGGHGNPLMSGAKEALRATVDATF